ncbi:ParB N-terminal domain-containing protein, partial [Bifidobacterium longum]|nr:ParB N-terminal domain-containing protein [Bifidobacterium longum]
MDEVLYDLRGNPINRQVEGELSLASVPLSDILIPPRSKLLVDDLMDLEESIRMWGLMEPLHVVPFEDKYILLHGYRRYLALRNL